MSNHVSLMPSVSANYVANVSFFHLGLSLLYPIVIYPFISSVSLNYPSREVSGRFSGTIV
jgi:hypothetical protein